MGSSAGSPEDESADGSADPLAERFKHLTSKELELVSKALKAEERIRSNWYILTPSGELHPIELKGDDIISVEVQRDKGRVKYYLSVKPELKKKLDRQVLGVALRKILRKKFGVPTPNIFVYFK